MNIIINENNIHILMETMTNKIKKAETLEDINSSLLQEKKQLIKDKKHLIEDNKLLIDKNNKLLNMLQNIECQAMNLSRCCTEAEVYVRGQEPDYTETGEDIFKLFGDDY